MIDIDKNNIPQHIGIIMDGNGRWAKKKFMPRTAGHKEGIETLGKITEASIELGIKYLTVYAFSTENWKRSKDEVGALMKLLYNYLSTEGERLNREGIRLKHIGDISALPDKVYEKLKEIEKNTANNLKITLTLALNYGARNDIKNALVKLIKEDRENKINLDDLDDDFLRSYLSSNFLPDPDLIIRPSGEYRLSNFLMWEAVYSELWFSNINWPDFKEGDLHEAIKAYQNRDRRFGGIK